MQISHPFSMLLFFVVLGGLLLSLVAVSVKYSREPVTKAEGDFLTLNCTVLYDLKTCKGIQTTWCLLYKPDHCEALIDPHRYLIQVNETEETKKDRRRNIFIMFNSLRLQDSGYYQCNAKCDSGTEAKGHLVNLNVTGFKVSKWSGQIKADTSLLLLSVILLLYSF